MEDGDGGGSNPLSAAEKVAAVDAFDDDGPSSRYFRVCHPYFLGGVVQHTGRGGGVKGQGGWLWTTDETDQLFNHSLC